MRLPLQERQGRSRGVQAAHEGEARRRAGLRLPVELADDDLACPPLRVAIVGKRNAGKSTLINTLAGEERVIQRLLSEGPTILSLGGGAFMSEATRQAIAEAGISVWLKADIELLMSRVLRRPGTRPLLNTPDPKATLRQLQEKREPVYALADLHVESSRISKTHTRDAVLAALEEKLLGQQKS